MGDLFTYPLSSEIWGTVSDWGMIVVTIVSVALLWRTLKAQEDVMKLQLKATRIANEEYRRNNLPIFTVSYKNIKATIEDQNVTSIIDIEIKLSNSFCRNVNTSITSDNSQLTFRQRDIFHQDVVEENSINRIEVSSLTTFPLFEEVGAILDINITFLDPVENEYIQTSKITIANGLTRVEDYSTPTLVTT